MIRIWSVVLACGIALVFNTSLSAQVANYPWPEGDPDIISTQYSMRVRDIDTVNQAYGDWQEITVFNVKPRLYGSHPIYGDDGTFSKTANKITSFGEFEIPGVVEVEVTKKYGSPASRVEIAPKAFGLEPHFFDGNTVRFVLQEWAWVSVNFVCPENWESDLGHIRYGMVVLADIPESEAGYDIPQPDDPGVVVWKNDIDIDSIRNAEIVYFPAGDIKMKNHKDSYNDFITAESTMKSEPLYKGQLRLKRSQKIYLAPGAYVRGCFNTKGFDECWLYGRGIISGRDYYQHEIIIPRPDGDGGWELVTATKEAFVDFLGADNSFISGIVIMEPFHHALPGANNSLIEHVKIFGMGGNHDGIRTGNNTIADGLFIKTWDDYDYASNPHTVKNSVFWPGSNGATHMVGWGNYGSGGATYANNYIINSEWENPKNNSGVLGSNATEGIKHSDVSFENYFLENFTSYLVNVSIQGEGTGAETWMKNYTFRNIKVEYPFTTSEGEPMKQRMIGLSDNGNKGYLENWKFINLVVDGTMVNWFNYKDYFDLDLVGTNGNNVDESKVVKNVSFQEEGFLYAITVTKGDHGSVYPTGSYNMIHCPEGSDQAVYIIPDDSYKIKEVVVDGVNLGRRQVIAFTDIGENHSIDVSFEIGADYFDLEPVIFRKPVSVSKPTSSGTLKIWPNPASDYIYIASGSIQDHMSNFTIYDVCGSQVSSGRFEEGKRFIGVEDLDAGVYFIRISGINGMHEVNRFVIGRSN